MPGAFRVSLARAHDPELAIKFLTKKSRPQIVTPHVCGEDDSAICLRKCAQVLFARQIVAKRCFINSMDRRFRNGPGKILKNGKGSEEVPQALAGIHQRQVAGDRSARSSCQAEEK